MKKILFLLSFTLSLVFLKAQIGVNTDSPDVTAIVEIYSTSKGVLIPRLSNGERDKILAPAEGLIIYNINKNCVEINVGSAIEKKWVCLPGKPVSKVP